VGKMSSTYGNLKYDRLTEVMLAILAVPQSNAGCERIFSQVTKTRTQFRLSLFDKTLEKQFTLKSTQKGKYFEQNFDSALLKKAKSATVTCSKQQYHACSHMFP
jgi:hypothetical protein